MTAPTDRATSDDTARVDRIEHRNRLLTIMVIALAVVVVVLGGWVIYNLVGGTSTSEAEQAIDAYNTAWEEQDPEALLAVVTDDFLEEYHWYTRLGDQVSVGSESWGAASAASYAASTDYRIELSGEAIVVGDGPWFVSVTESQTGGGFDYEGTAGYVVVDDDGTLKVARKSWIGSRQPVTG